MGVKEIEIEFAQASIGVLYRRIKIAVWLCFALTALLIIALVAFIPSCHFLHVPAAVGCYIGGITFDGFITIFAFFNIGLVVGVAAILGIVKQVLISLFVIRKW
jgi:hypothetical protein